MVGIMSGVEISVVDLMKVACRWTESLKIAEKLIVVEGGNKRGSVSVGRADSSRGESALTV